MRVIRSRRDNLRDRIAVGDASLAGDALEKTGIKVYSSLVEGSRSAVVVRPADQREAKSARIHARLKRG